MTVTGGEASTAAPTGSMEAAQFALADGARRKAELRGEVRGGWGASPAREFGRAVNIRGSTSELRCALFRLTCSRGMLCLHHARLSVQRRASFVFAVLEGA